MNQDGFLATTCSQVRHTQTSSMVKARPLLVTNRRDKAEPGKVNGPFLLSQQKHTYKPTELPLDLPNPCSPSLAPSMRPVGFMRLVLLRIRGTGRRSSLQASISSLRLVGSARRWLRRSRLSRPLYDPVSQQPKRLAEVSESVVRSFVGQFLEMRWLRVATFLSPSSQLLLVKLRPLDGRYDWARLIRCCLPHWGRL